MIAVGFWHVEQHNHRMKMMINHTQLNLLLLSLLGLSQKSAVGQVCA